MNLLNVKGNTMRKYIVKILPIITLVTMITLAAMLTAGCAGTTPDASTEERLESSEGDEIVATAAPAEELSPEELERKTIDSLTELYPGVYYIDCYSDYKIDEYLSSDISEVGQLDVWMTDSLTHGVPTGDLPDTGCSSFAITDSSGNHLFGRNYDMRSGDSLIIRTYPQTGYSSIGIVDLSHVNLGKGGSYDIHDEDGKNLLLAAPWCICDGINEKGLGVSLLELDKKHTVMDTEKGDLLIYTALRVILDRCGTIDEAVELLNSYDMYSPRPNTYHIFITDISGRSVAVEWDNGETFVAEDKAATNVMIHKGNVYDPRYLKMHQTLDGADSLNADEAMELLKSVKQSTRWSAVYNLEKFSVDICFNDDYENVISY